MKETHDPEKPGERSRQEEDMREAWAMAKWKATHPYEYQQEETRREIARQWWERIKKEERLRMWEEEARQMRKARMEHAIRWMLAVAAVAAIVALYYYLAR